MLQAARRSTTRCLAIRCSSSHRWTLPAIAAVVVLLGGPAGAPADIWEANETAALKRAKEQNKPLIIFFRKDGGDPTDKSRDAVVRAFRDPTVVELARTYYVPLQADIRVEKTLKRELGAKAHDVLITTPEGDLLVRLSRQDARNAEKIVDHLHATLRTWRDRVYDGDIKPVLTRDEAQPQALRKALARVSELNVEKADADIIALLDREKLDGGIRHAAFATLADLSTEDAVDALLAHADKYPAAGEALRKCKRSAAAHLVEKLRGHATPAFLRAYRAAASICKVRARPDEFWTTADETARRQEIERITSIAAKSG